MTGTERAELKAETLMRASARYGRTTTTTDSMVARFGQVPA